MSTAKKSLIYAVFGAMVQLDMSQVVTSTTQIARFRSVGDSKRNRTYPKYKSKHNQR